MKKITYNNKQYVLNDPQYPVEETVTDTDMNEIKEVVNFNADETLEENIKIKEQLEQTKDALINITTPKSSNINVKDSSDLNAKVDVFGISEQETREGYNKFDYDTIEGLAGSTIKTSVDGLNVYKRTSSNQNIWPLFNLNDVLEDGKAYTMCFDIWADAQTSFNNQRFYVNTTTETTHNLSNITTAKQRLIANFTYTKNDSNAIIHIYPTTSETNNFYIANVMLLEGTFTSENIPNYEQYGASPSPEFPSEIENVTGDIDITVCNKNYLDINSSELHRSSGVTTEISNNKVTAEGSGTNNIYCSIPLKLKPNTDYVVSFLATVLENDQPTINPYVVIRKGKSSGAVIGSYVYIYGDVHSKQSRQGTFNSKDNTSLWLWLYLNPSTNLQKTVKIQFENIQVEEGTTATDYIEHKEQLITFPLAQGQRLYNGDYLANDGIHHVRDTYTFKAVTSLASHNNNRFGTNVSAVNSVNTANILSDRIVGSDSTKENTGYITGGGETIVIYGNPADTVKSFNERFVGTKIEYPLAKEKIEAYTPEQQEAYDKLQKVLSYKTETNVFTDKALLEFKYIADTKTYIDNKYNNLAQQFLNL